MTAFTTLPFFTVPSGDASFTAAVITSPRKAFLPNPPPRGRIICSLRAPELSATASIDLICTAMVCSPYAVLLGCRGSVFNLTERRAAHDLFKSPTLELARRTGLADANDIAYTRRILLVVSVELLRALDDAL